MKALRIAVIALFAAAAMLILTGCPPTPRCDEKIKDKQSIEEAVRADLAIRQFDTVFTELQLQVFDCYVDGTVGVNVNYLLPADFSTYDLVYRDFFMLAYSQTGTIGLGQGWDNPSAYDLASVSQFFQGHVQKIEGNPRVRELLEKTGPDPVNHVMYLAGNMEIMRSGNNRAEYSFMLDKTYTYLLSNDIDWQEYLEIGLAHQVIEENLLVGPLASCSIGHGKMHAYTTARGDTESGVWYVTVALQCADGWKDAYVQINPDGSYERLQIQTEY